MWATGIGGFLAFFSLTLSIEWNQNPIPQILEVSYFILFYCQSTLDPSTFIVLDCLIAALIVASNRPATFSSFLL